jgi:ADP-ribosyl-[dinitrogen reductase] hydrolase
MQSEVSPARREASLYGALVGCAVGDALGIAYENLSPRRVLRLFPDPTRYHLLPSVGLISDDAEQAMMTLRALACSGGAPERFLGVLATELRVWLATLPAGIGLSTARAGIRLWLGVSLQRSGVRSAGNAPALRGAILGVAFADNPQRRETLTRLATRITHTDPKAEAGALFCADLAALATQSAGAPLPADALRQRVDACPAELREPLRAALASVDAGQSTEAVRSSRRAGGAVCRATSCIRQRLRCTHGSASPTISCKRRLSSFAVGATPTAPPRCWASGWGRIEASRLCPTHCLPA